LSLTLFLSILHRYDPAKEGGRGEKRYLRRSVVVEGSRRRHVLQLDRTCLLLAAAVNWMASWPWSSTSLNLCGGSPPESP
uniref:Uncharacterized protein n=1 Tax=Aegilops tauschii subsp. strangulata TaxID=200361 RepID=A0A453I7I7_AEGTS